MRRTLLLSSVLAGMALAVPAMAQNPFSTKASNINSSDISSPIAPALPSTGLGPNASIPQVLGVASSALTAGKTGLAQQALENAETLALTRSVPYNQAGQRDDSPLVMNLYSARQALGKGDLAGAKHFTDLATQAAGQ